MPDIYAVVGRRIREERLARHLSLRELAELAGTTASFLGQIERGNRKLSLATLQKVILALGLSAGELMGAQSPRSKPSWEQRIARLVSGQHPRRQKLVFQILKFAFRQFGKTRP